MKSDLVDLTVYVVRDEPTDKAVLVQEDRDKEKIWLPRSKIEISYDSPIPGTANITLPEWLALDKGLI